MSPLPRLVPLALFLLFAGCVSPGSKSIVADTSALTTSVNVTDSMRSLTVQPTRLGKVESFEIDQRTQVLQRDGKRQFALLLGLPATSGAFSVKLCSVQFGTLKDFAILYPEVRLLDFNREVLRTMPSEIFVYRSELQRNFLEGVVFINEPSGNERYVLITNRQVHEADQLQAASNLTIYSSMAIPLPGDMVFWTIPTGISTAPRKLLASPTGTIEVLVEEYRPRKIQ